VCWGRGGWRREWGASMWDGSERGTEEALLIGLLMAGAEL